MPRHRPPARPFARIPLPSGAAIDLWQGDALEELGRRVRAADVVVTSPPYNRGVAYANYADRRPRGDYLRWMGDVGEAVARVLAPRGSFFLNLSGAPKDPWLPWDVAREVGRSFVLQNVLHWVKSIAIDRSAAGRAAGLSRDLALGHYRPAASGRYVHGAHEYIFHFTRDGTVPIDRLAIGVPYQDKSNVRRWARLADRRCRGNTWFLPYATIRRRATDRPHPASFPPELPEWCLRLHGIPRTRLVVDPFVGIGSTGVAAARLGLAGIGIDLDEGYLGIAAERIRSEVARRGGPISRGLRGAGTPRRRPGPTTASSGSAARPRRRRARSSSLPSRASPP
jgi:site-specific DNA-methyltransferase (adenine-specific)